MIHGRLNPVSLSVIDNHIMLPSVHCSLCPRFDEAADGTTKEAVSGTINSSFKRIIPATGFNTTLNSTRDRTLCSANGCTGSEAGNTVRSYSSNNGSANNQGCTDGNLSPVGQGPGTGFIPIVDRIIHTIDEELVAVDVAISTQSFHIVCIDETA